MNPLSLLVGWKGYALAAVVAFGGGFGSCWRLRDQMAAHDRLRAAERVLKDQAHTAKRVEKADAITADVGAKAEAGLVEIRWRTRTILKEIPIYVTPEADRRFAVPNGLVRLHDAAALGVDPAALPNPTGEPDDAASEVAASAFGSAVADNYGTCNEVIEKYGQLQSWVRQQSAAWAQP